MPLRRSIAATVAVAFAITLTSLALDASRGRSPTLGAAGPSAVIVGDSLTGGNADFITSQLRSAGLGSVRVEGLSARRIAHTFEFRGLRDSGIDRIRALRSSGVETDLWVIQLGTNDLVAIERCECPNRVVFAAALIRSLVDEIGRDDSIAWVTVHDQIRPELAADFNTAIFLASFSHPRMTMIQWQRRAADRPDWFLDNVHPNVAGLRAFTEMYIDEIGSLLARPFNRDEPQTGLFRAERVAPRAAPAFGAMNRPL